MQNEMNLLYVAPLQTMLQQEQRRLIQNELNINRSVLDQILSQKKLLDTQKMLLDSQHLALNNHVIKVPGVRHGDTSELWKLPFLSDPYPLNGFLRTTLRPSPVIDFKQSLSGLSLAPEPVHFKEEEFEQVYLSPQLVDKLLLSENDLPLQTERGNKEYICTRCSYKSMYRSAVYSHMRCHRPRKHECLLCHFTTKRKRVYNKHMKVHHGKITHRCHKLVRRKHDQVIDRCSFISRRNIHMFLHRVKHKIAKRWTSPLLNCNHCFFQTPRKNMMRRHIANRHSRVKAKNVALPVSCKCNSPCRNKPCISASAANVEEQTVKVLMYMHFGVNPYRCSRCPFGTTQQSLLTTHLEKHTPEHHCPKCNYTTKWKHVLANHLKTTHGSEQPFCCKECDYTTRHKNALNTHMLVHRGDRKYKCHICNYSAIQKVHLDVHMYKHNGKKPHKCPLCKYETAAKASLKAHMCTHTGVRPHRCGHCEYRSARKADLKKHEKIRHKIG